MDPRAEDVLGFWLDEVGPERWYATEDALDDAIRARFQALWADGAAGRLDGWTHQPRSCLALVILLDQFPRNMFRASGKAFASDPRALSVAKAAIARGLDERVPVPERQFFYLPLMHSELLSDQDRSVRLFVLSFGAGESLDHARAHREIIRRFGRFPYRNEALGRTSTPAEDAFMANGGYAAAVREIQARQPA